MKKKFVFFWIIIFVLVILLGFYVKLEVMPDYKENALKDLGYKNIEYGYGFNPVEGWNKSMDVKNGLLLSYECPDDSRINIVVGFMPPNCPDLHKPDIIDSVVTRKMNLTNFSLISSNEKIINGLQAYEIVYTYNDYEFGSKYQEKYVLIKGNSGGIIMWYEYPIEYFDNYLSIVDDSINSVVII